MRIVGGEETDGSEEDEDEEDPFALSGGEDEDPIVRSDDDDEAGSAKGCQVLERNSWHGRYYRDGVPKIPVFLGHGTEDEKVSVELGREAETALELMGMDVQMKEYEGLGHRYSENMLRDIFRFIKEKLEIEETEESRDSWGINRRHPFETSHVPSPMHSR